MMNRRAWLRRAAGYTAGTVAALVASRGTALALPLGAPHIDVKKQVGCGCCTKWVEHLRANGFDVTAAEDPNVDQFKDQVGVPPALRSCHTATVEGYVVEGHVPAADIKRMLAQRPAIIGLAAPGMPMGSPGMEMPGMAPDPYDVIAFGKDGKTRVWAKH
ncbi:MAG TPA: DUF411 domain-containing protein [Gemmatimonadaceae bacterium]